MGGEEHSHKTAGSFTTRDIRSGGFFSQKFTLRVYRDDPLPHFSPPSSGGGRSMGGRQGARSSPSPPSTDPCAHRRVMQRERNGAACFPVSSSCNHEFYLLKGSWGPGEKHSVIAQELHLRGAISGWQELMGEAN